MNDCRQWSHYVVPMPVTADGCGPAVIGRDAHRMVYEVWDRENVTHSSHDNLSDAINAALCYNGVRDEAADRIEAQAREIGKMEGEINYQIDRANKAERERDALKARAEKAEAAFLAARMPEPINQRHVYAEGHNAALDQVARGRRALLAGR
jgi:hypothetical protein